MANYNDPTDVEITQDREVLAGVFRGDCKDQIVTKFKLKFDEPMTNPDTVLRKAWEIQESFPSTATLPHKLEQNGDLKHLFAWEFKVEPSPALKLWYVTVMWMTSPFGYNKQWMQQIDPTQRPGRLYVVYQEEQIDVRTAKNVDAFPGGGTGGYQRPAGTTGPIRNTAGGAPFSPIVRSRTNPVYCVERYYENMDTVVAQDTTLRGTTNSDQFNIKDVAIGKKEMAYVGYVIEGEEDDWYYQIGTQDIIERELVRATFRFMRVAGGTTDLPVENDGARHWKQDSGGDTNQGWSQSQEDARLDETISTSEPMPLNMEGSPNPSQPITIDYEYLTPKQYYQYFGNLQ